MVQKRRDEAQEKEQGRQAGPKTKPQKITDKCGVAMNYSSLSLEELRSFATTDDGARQYLAENIDQIIEDNVADFDGYDPAGCYDDGWNTGKKEILDELRGKYHEQLAEWVLLVPDMAIAGDHDMRELETLLGALHAELAIEERPAGAADLSAIPKS